MGIKKKRNTSCHEANYNYHIRKAREAARGLHGYERALKISEYFEEAGHPHAHYTFTELRMSDNWGQTDREFAIDLMQKMAYLLAINEMNRNESFR